MAEFATGGHKYRTLTMPARTSFHVGRKIGPIIPALGQLWLASGMLKEILNRGPDAEITAKDVEDIGDSAQPILDWLAKQSEEDTDYVMDKCFAACERQNDAGGWAKLIGDTSKTLMFRDLSSMDEMVIAYRVLEANFSSFTVAARSASRAAIQA